VKSNDTPGTEAEADALRAYVPLELLAALAKTRDEEIAEHDKRRRKFDEQCAEYNTIKERMRRDRITLKKLEAEKRAYFAQPLFPRTDAARDAAWSAAVQARREAIERGESPRYETAAQCGARQKSAAQAGVYTP
jgi:hypothetical protein